MPSGQQQDSAKEENKDCGKQSGKKQKKKRKKKHLNFVESKDSESEGATFYFVYTTSVPSMVDLQVAMHQSVQLYQRSVGLPMFSQTQEAFTFAHHLSIKPFMELICSLDTTLLLLQWLDFSSPLMSLPASSSSTPPASISLLLVSYIKTIPEDNEPIVYNYAFSMEDLDLLPPSKRSWKWVSKVTSSWDEENKVDVYGSDKDMADFYDQYMKDPKYMAFPMIAASSSSLPLPTHTYAALSRVDQVYTYVSDSNTTMDISYAHSLRNKCNHCKPKPQWILDSGASMHFFPKRDDFVEYITFPKKDHILVHTTTGNIHVIGIGKCIVPWRDSNESLQHLTFVGMGHIPNSGVHLVSMGQLLASSTTVQGNRSSIHMLYGDGTLLAPFTPLPCFRHNIYIYIGSSITSA